MGKWLCIRAAIWVSALAMLYVSSASGSLRPAVRPSFETSVLPLLEARCVSCHGADHPRTGLDVRTRGNLLEGGHSGPAVVPGAPDKSLLYKLVASGKMPPGGPKLSPSEIKRIETWIRSGADGKTTTGHWAFRAPVRPNVPAIQNPKSKVQNPIDSFLLTALKRRGLGFSREADRRTLIRRVTFDLIGLPPTPEEVTAFLQDRSPNAYEKVVDRLLADPRYGERWARHWLDPAGYADSEGVLQEDLVRTNAWRYRDYVIRSFNADKPYDRFIREQIAGDELFDYRRAEHFTPEIEEALTATGFLRTAVDATRPDFNPHQFQEYQLRMLNDTETILATTVMGLPLQCARCHDHKYEPLSQKDYYRIQALFAGAVRPDGPLLPSRVRHVVDAGLAEQRAAKETNQRIDAAVRAISGKQNALADAFRQRLLADKIGEVAEPERQPLSEALRTDTGKRSPAQKALVEKYKTITAASVDQLSKTYAEFQTKNTELQNERNSEEAKRVILPEIRAIYDQDAKPPPTHLLARGEWSRPGEVVEPGVPSILNACGKRFAIPLAPADAQSTGRRKAFAEWLTRPDHPLTSRVLVNRLWAHHFGTGIVATLDNFGRSGAQPTNQALLDWLAVSFVEGKDSGEPAARAKPWSIKRIQRLIVTSAAYRQESRFRQEAARLDPENLLLWRQRSRRLEAEAMRDAMLAVAGNLDSKMYGEAVPTQTREGGDIVAAGEENSGRRSIYLLVRRSEPVTILNTFDAPVMETNCTRRTVSSTATQSLAMMNSSFISAEAKRFAARLLKSIPSTDRGPVDERLIVEAFRLAYGRVPAAAELASSAKFIAAQAERYGKMNKERKIAGEMALADFCQALLAANEFVYVD